MNDGADLVRPALQKLATELTLSPALRPRGSITRVGDGVAEVAGLEGVGYEELLVIDNGAMGMAYDILRSSVSVILLNGGETVRAGMGVTAMRSLPSMLVGAELRGRIIDPLGRPLDGRTTPPGERWPVFRPAPRLTERAAVARPLFTGVMAIDAAIPIGRGQRQLVIGDRNVGKTALALEILCAQRAGDVTCVYVLVGQPLSRVLSVRQTLSTVGALDNTVIIAADASASPGMRYLAPAAGATVAEWFRSRGGDALIVYDDLTKHADAYRELALLVGRPPGREAYPGDIFYIHAELLERATPMREELGGGSVTALPLVETTDSDISAYIPTNLISITDGQFYLDATRFGRNQRPAIDIGRSVSRIGGVAQPPVMRRAAKNLRIMISRFEALESLSRVGLDIDPVTKQTIHRGRIMREALKQERFRPRSVADQVLVLTAIQSGWVDALEPAAALATLSDAAVRIRAERPQLAAALDASGDAPDDWTNELEQMVAACVAQSSR